MVTKVVIDETELYKVRGKNDTDHNTICIDINIKDLNETKVIKKTDWNLRASEEKWAKFSEELEERQAKAEQILMNKEITFEDRYKMWYNQLDTAARKSIGKTI